MTDAQVASALRSDASLVVVEAPAGCGKTHQGAAYAGDIAPALGDGRLLILTHTHAAREVFAARTRTASHRVEIRTIDSFITEIGSIYHAAIGLPADVPGWARAQKGYDDVAGRVARLLGAAPPLRAILAHRYPVAVFDEHQDASASQNEIALALRAGGARLRMFGDPMQAIYAGKSEGFTADRKRWEELCLTADHAVALSEPHRWASANMPLGRWVLAAHTALKRGEPLNLTTDLPVGVRVIRADNLGAGFKYRPAPAVAAEMNRTARQQGGALVLTYRNDTAKALHGAVGRGIPIWEGHTRSALDTLALAIERAHGADDLCAAVIAFVQDISVGFSDSAFATRLLSEVQTNCSKVARGMPATLQALARCLLDDPTHRGVAAFLIELERLTRQDRAFESVHFHHPRELRDAMQFADHDDAGACLAMLAQQRAHRASAMPHRAISTIHKSKGLETDQVLIVPMDAVTFPDNDAARCLLYVAISRAKAGITLVVPNDQPSPLLKI